MIDDVTVRARLKDELSRPAKKVEDQLERTAKAADKLASPRRNRELGRTDRSFANLTRTLGRLDRGLLGVSQRMGDFVGRQLRRATVGMAAFTGAVGFFGLKSASSFEQTQIAFEGLLGSAERGQRLFRDLQEYNKRSPFGLEDVTGAARQLLGFQFDETQILPLVKSSADAAAALGAGAAGLDRIILNLGQVQATGKVTGRELRDFATVGFPGYALVADILGVTREEIKALGDDAEVSADQFIRAVIDMQGPLQQFSGMAEKQQKSLAGLWSNIKDIWQVRLVGAMDPLLDKLRPMLDLQSGSVPALLDQAVTSLGPPMVELLGLVVDLAVGALPVVQPILTALISGVALLVDTALPGLSALGPVTDDLVLAIGEFFDVLAPQMPVLVEAFVSLVGVLPEFVQLLGRLATLVTPIANVVNGLLALDGADTVVAGLLATLLGYQALRSVATAVAAMATALFALGDAQLFASAAGAASGGVGGVGGVAAGAGKWGRAAGPGLAGLVGVGVGGEMAHGASSVGGALAGVGASAAGGALTGAAIGSVVPIIGTGIGAAVGGLGGILYGSVRGIQGQGDRRAAAPVPELAAAPVTMQGDTNTFVIQSHDPDGVRREVQQVLDTSITRRIDTYLAERDRRR